MKKLLLGALAFVAVFSLAACGEKKEENKPVEESSVVVEEQTTPVEEQAVSGEEQAVSGEGPLATEVEEKEFTEEEREAFGNTDEGMVVLVLDEYLNNTYGPIFEEINFTSVKVYSEEEVEANEAIKSHDLKEGDIPFSVEYEFKVRDEVEDLNQFTAGTGEIDGRWIRNKANIGIARSGEDGYTLDAFGTGW